MFQWEPVWVAAGTVAVSSTHDRRINEAVVLESLSCFISSSLLEKTRNLRRCDKSRELAILLSEQDGTQTALNPQNIQLLCSKHQNFD